MFNRFRRKIALRFGKLEHISARLLGIAIILAIFLERYRLKLVMVSLFLWLIYLLSHILEKRFYPSNFR